MKAFPEPSKLIRVKCEDWSPYEVTGMFIPYKPGSGKRTGKSRFCKLEESGEFTSDRASWQGMVSWEYVEPHAGEGVE